MPKHKKHAVFELTDGRMAGMRIVASGEKDISRKLKDPHYEIVLETNSRKKAEELVIEAAIW